MKLSGKDVANIRERWKSKEGERYRDVLLKSLSSSKPSPDYSVFGEVGGKRDLRGISLEGLMIKKSSFQNLDLSYSNLENAWIESSTFENVLFYKTNLRDASDHGNSFRTVQFFETDFRYSQLGYDGSRFEMCDFVNCNFSKAGWTRAELKDCVFDNCRLNGVDFNVSRLERCKFIGLLDDVWFRAEYASPKFVEKYGPFNKNTMDWVDFSEAKLSWLSFSGGVPLGSIRLPDDPFIFYLDRLDEVLPKASKLAEERFEGEERDAALFFFQVQLQLGISKQTERIFTIADYIKSKPQLSTEFLNKLKSLLFEVREKL